MRNALLLSVLLFGASLMMIGCSRHSDFEHPDRPSTEEEEDLQLKDSRMRIESSLLSLDYDEGGVLFSRATDGTISGVRVDDGASFDFDPEAPSLHINGVDHPLMSAKLAKETPTGRWYRLTLADGTTDVYIVIMNI